MKQKVLGIVGSPRRGANTETLVDQVLKGSEESGAAVEKIILSEMNIKPCNACNGCQKTGTCTHDDDFNSVLEKMKESSVWVMGTPVYWWGPTAQMKAFIDRWYGIDRSVFRGKRIVYTIPSGGGPYYAKQLVEMLESLIPYLGMEHIATLQTGTSGMDSVKNNNSLMKQALDAGRKAVNK
ncbi:MAG: flavodoxin family protein [Candidatus Bathyarchaeota archaeon]|nr:flavodoxin family protein [Candidatus Bathyarchaeota archaeon]